MSHACVGYCPRCAREVSVLGVWPGFLWAKRAWYGGLLLIAALMPVILSEITVLLPMAVVFAMAAGPVHQLAAQRPSCRSCGLELGAQLTAATTPDSTRTR
jgi:hypothetical protein